MTNLVDQLIQQRKSGDAGEGVPEKIEYKQVPISVGGNSMVMMPPNVIKSDGSVDIVINFKGVNSPAHASATGQRAVMVSVYEPEGGKYKFGNYGQYGADFVNRAVNTIISSLQKANPGKPVKRGKLTITGWSAGGSALKSVLANEEKVQGGVDEVVFSDALHASRDPAQMDQELAAVANYARKAAKDPNKKLVLVSTGVVPGDKKGQTYASTYETGKRLAELVGAQETNTGGRFYEGGRPAGVSQAGGFQWVKLYEPGKYSVDEMKDQHGYAYRWTTANQTNLG